MGTHQPIRKTVLPEIPDKLYFRIGDVARLCQVPTYVLRFWETEFPQLKPNKGGTGQRLYRKRDVELALRIKGLLYDQGYTIPGARQVFKNEAAARSAASAAPIVEPQISVPAAMDTRASQNSAPEDTGSALRRLVRLRDLRAEMAALLQLLNDAPVDAKPTLKVQPMRPRLVLEPRLAGKQDMLQGGTGPRLQRTQSDLFGVSPKDGSDEWPEPPVAS